MQILNKLRLAGTTILIATHDDTIRQRYPAREIRLDKGKVISDAGVESE